MKNAKSREAVTPPRYPHPDPRQWLSAITADRETHVRLVTLRGRLEWLFAFGSRSQASLPEERQPEELAREIGLFMFMSETVKHFVAQAAFYAIMDPPTRELAQTVVKDLSVSLGEGLAAFVDKGAWTLKLNRPLLRTVHKSGFTGSPYNQWSPPDWRPVLRPKLYGQTAEVWTTCFLLAAADAVFAEAKNIRRCAGCGVIFVDDDPRAKYHSPKCATAHRVSAWRARAEEKAQKRRLQASKSKGRRVK